MIVFHVYFWARVTTLMLFGYSGFHGWFFGDAPDLPKEPGIGWESSDLNPKNESGGAKPINACQCRIGFCQKMIEKESLSSSRRFGCYVQKWKLRTICFLKDVWDVFYRALLDSGLLSLLLYLTLIPMVVTFATLYRDFSMPTLRRKIYDYCRSFEEYNDQPDLQRNEPRPLEYGEPREMDMAGPRQELDRHGLPVEALGATGGRKLRNVVAQEDLEACQDLVTTGAGISCVADPDGRMKKEVRFIDDDSLVDQQIVGDFRPPERACSRRESPGKKIVSAETGPRNPRVMRPGPGPSFGVRMASNQ